jgi:hypothetical protein
MVALQGDYEVPNNLKFDARIWVIVGTVVLMVVVTVAIYLFAYCVVLVGPLNSFFKPWIDPEKEIGAVFAAWVGGLALFVIAGAFVAIVSLERPEQGSFDARARILFRRQHGRHVDYIVSRIKQALEHYAESTVVTVTIKSYDAAESKYRISRDSKTLVRSYIDDVQTKYVTKFDTAEVTLPPPGRERNRLIHVRVRGDPVGGGEDFDDKISRELSCDIAPGGSCEVHSLIEHWVLARTEPTTHRPIRYTQSLSVTFDNQLDSDVVIEYKTLDATDFFHERVPAGRAKKVIEIKDLTPGDVVFDYRILPP